MRRIIIVVLALVCFAATLSASTPDDEILLKIKSITEEGYFTFAKKDFMQASAYCEQILEKERDNLHAKYYLAYSAYRLMNIAMVDGNSEEMSRFEELGIAEAESLLESDIYKSEAHTLIAAITMMELAASPLKGMLLSGKIHSHLDDAIEANPANPRAYLVKGIMINNTPGMFGGGSDKALPLLLKASELFKSENTTGLKPSWGKLENLAWIGQALSSLERYEEAEKVYREALEINPDFNWVKYDLLPTVEAKLSNNKQVSK